MGEVVEVTASPDGHAAVRDMENNVIFPQWIVPSLQDSLPNCFIVAKSCFVD